MFSGEGVLFLCGGDKDACMHAGVWIKGNVLKGWVDVMMSVLCVNFFCGCVDKGNGLQ